MLIKFMKLDNFVTDQEELISVSSDIIAKPLKIN